MVPFLKISTSRVEFYGIRPSWLAPLMATIFLLSILYVELFDPWLILEGPSWCLNLAGSIVGEIWPNDRMGAFTIVIKFTLSFCFLHSIIY